MTQRFWMLAFALLGLSAVIAIPTARVGAEEKKLTKEEEEAMKSDDDVRTIAMAYDLAAVGRKKSDPLMLVCAARLLKGTTFATRPGKEEATVAGSKDKFLAGGQFDLGEEANKLLGEAQKMAEKAKNQGLIDQIKKAMEEEGRGAVGGPKTYHHRPGAGATITLEVPFVGQAPGRVWVQSVSGNKFTLTVTGPRGRTGSTTGVSPSINWADHPAGTYTISVTNHGGAAAYTLFTN